MHHARASLAFAVLMGISASFSLSYSFVPPSVVSAAEKSISADGEYIVGDGLDESLGVAKIRAGTFPGTPLQNPSSCPARRHRHGASNPYRHAR